MTDFCAANDFKINRKTLGVHRGHITDPRATFVEKARRSPVITNGITNDDFLQAVADAAYAKIQAEPDSVKVSDGLKAIAIREARKAQQTNILIQIAGAFTGHGITVQPAPDVIEGSYTLLPPVEEPIVDPAA